MSDWLGLDGQRVVVAGGAGTFGAALVDGFRAAGSDVVAIDVQPGDHVQADLRDPDAARAAIEAAEQETGLVADDPVRFGAGRLVDAVLAHLADLDAPLTPGIRAG